MMKHNSAYSISIFFFIFLMSSFFFLPSGKVSSYALEQASASAINTGFDFSDPSPAKDSDSFSSKSLNPDSTGRKIRVAQFDIPNFFDYDRYGPIGGYGFEYLEKISSHTGWEYEYVSTSFKNALDMLENGELDMVLPATYAADLAERFSYSAKEIGLDYTMICVPVEDTETAYNDFAALNGIKIGLINGSPLNNNLDDFADYNHFSFERCYYQNHEALIKALHDGEVDAILLVGMEKGTTERIVAKFAPIPYYFITAKDNREILDPLNDALTRIKNNTPYYDYALQERYFNWQENTIPIFTAEEKKYIEDSDVLTAVFKTSMAPLEYYDEKSRTCSGINAGILELISEMTGLKFSYLQCDSTTDALSKITDHKADILTGVNNDVSWANEHHLLLTDSYLSSSIVLVKNTKAKHLDTAVIALTRDYLAANDYVQKTRPNAKIIYFNTPMECFDAVNSEKADITYVNSYVAEEIMNDPKLNKLEIVETVNLTENLCMGISDTADPLLLSILNKAINSLTPAQLDQIIFKYTLDQDPNINLEYVVYKKPVYFITFLALLFLAITVVLVIMIRNNNKHTEEIKKVAYLDSVTGTSNYIKFKRDAEALLKSSKDKKYAIVYIDIYKFSYINDTFGYQAGDSILAEVAKFLETNLGKAERSARISADNFVCLLEYTNENIMIERGYAFQQKCRDRLNSVDNRFRVHFTAGAYKISSGETDIPSLVGKAELAHKTLGDIHKAALVFYDNKIQNDFLRAKKLESSMTAALENEEFQVYLQPKTDLLSREIAGAEALVRWQHPEEGLIPPDQFIPLFESNGFIIELDLYVYKVVCKLLQEWLNAGYSPVPISVNVSKAHLANEQFTSQLKALIDKYNIPPKLLALELTESIFFENTQDEVTLIRRFKDLGFFILIDDFGSGYSSLNLLKDLPVDALKLDKEFFRREGMTEKDKIIVDGIIRIANDLKLNIVSEGIETQEQVDFLIASGCHMAQGYFFAKPMPVEDFEKLIGYH